MRNFPNEVAPRIVPAHVGLHDVPVILCACQNESIDRPALLDLGLGQGSSSDVGIFLVFVLAMNGRKKGIKLVNMAVAGPVSSIVLGKEFEISLEVKHG